MLENPFKPVTKEEDTDPAQNAKLVQAILGPDAAKKYAELDAGREGKRVDTREDLKLTDAEKAVVKEAHENQPWDRERYIAWAESLGKDEIWVDETFIFYDDGRVECENLDLDEVTELHEFPPNLTITVSLTLNSLQSAKGLAFPPLLERLNLHQLQSTDGLVLPDSLKSLGLSSLQSAVGLVLPPALRDLDLEFLQSADGLVLPPSLRELNLYSLQSADGLVLPDSLEWLWLSALLSAKGLVFPPLLKILSLGSLQSTDGLVLPPSLKELHFPRSLRAQVQELQEKGEIRKDIEIEYI